MKKDKLKISVLVNAVVIIAVIVRLLILIDDFNGSDYTGDQWIYLSFVSMFLLMISLSLSFFVLLDRLVTDKAMLVMGLFHLLFNLFGIIIYAFVVLSNAENYLADVILIVSIPSLILTSVFYYKKYDEITNY